MPTAGWLRRTDLPVDSGGRSYIDPPNLDQILDQFVNWRGNVNGGGYTLSNVRLGSTLSPNYMASLGLGTNTNPLRPLHVGAANFTEMLLEATDVADGIGTGRVWGFQNYSGTLSFRTLNAATSAAQTGVVILPGGSMGLGCSPRSLLELAGPNGLAGGLTIGHIADPTNVYHIYRDGASGILHFVGVQAGYVGYRFLVANTLLAMTIAGQGYIGMGTDPVMKLHVYGSGSAEVTGSAAMYSGGPHNATLLLQASDAVGNAGGTLLFGSAFGAGYFAGIKGVTISGSGNSCGDLAFLTRGAVEWAHIQESMRLTYYGRLILPGFGPNVNAGIIMGGYHIWVDAAGKLRIKSGAANFDTDGVVVGTQT